MKKKKRTKSLDRGTYGFYAMLENPHNPYFQTANRFLGLVTLIAVLAVVLETVKAFGPYQYWINIVEYVTVVIFTLEYIIRFKETRPRKKYVFGFFGIIDLLAIIPTILGLGNFTFLKSTRSIRTIRLLRIARLAKLARAKGKDSGSWSVLGINFEIYLLALFMLIILLGGLFHLFESQLKEAESIPMGMLWVIKIVVGGIPTAEPETFGGMMTLILTNFSAVMIFGFIIGLFGGFVQKSLLGGEA
jgi:voltage-gated potassium channel